MRELKRREEEQAAKERARKEAEEAEREAAARAAAQAASAEATSADKPDSGATAAEERPGTHSSSNSHQANFAKFIVNTCVCYNMQPQVDAGPL